MKKKYEKPILQCHSIYMEDAIAVGSLSTGGSGGNFTPEIEDIVPDDKPIDDEFNFEV